MGHKALAVVEPDRGEVHAQVGYAFSGPGSGTGQNVDLPGSQGGKAVFGGGGQVLDLVCIPQHRSGHSAAQVYVHTGPAALVIDQRKPRFVTCYPAAHAAMGFDLVQHTCLGSLGTGQQQGQQRSPQQKLGPIQFVHIIALLKFFLLCLSTTIQRQVAV